MSSSKGLPNPSYYVEALQGEFSKWAFDEDRALKLKGHWLEKAFEESQGLPLDLEIGTGNGFHFAHYAKENPDRRLVGIELKFKPLIQSIRRALNDGAQNARIMRYDAAFIHDLFAENEIDDVIIHHPDPWPKLKQRKHRLIQNEFLQRLFKIQKSGCRVEFKTDSRDYFDDALEKFKASPYLIEKLTYDLHNSEYADENFVTHFEKIFLKKQEPIHMCQLRKPND